MRRWRYTPDVILDLAERRLAGQSHARIVRDTGADDGHLRRLLRDLVPSKYQSKQERQSSK
jgi:hypothetical protein